MGIEELQAKILGGLLSSDTALYKKRMGQVLRKLGDEYFLNLNKNVFIVMKRYYRLTMDRISKQEFMDAFRKEGAAMTTRENVHRMAEANKAFAHFAW